MAFNPEKFKSSFLGPEIISNKLFIQGCSYFVSPMGTFPVALVTWTIPPTFRVILPSNPLLLEMLVKHKPSQVTYFSFWIFNDIPSLILKFKGFLKGWSKPLSSSLSFYIPFVSFNWQRLYTVSFLL